jgi:hypothetical protein
LEGILSGNRIERRQIGASGEFDDLTDDHWSGPGRDRFNSLGLTRDRRH